MASGRRTTGVAARKSTSRSRAFLVSSAPLRSAPLFFVLLASSACGRPAALDGPTVTNDFTPQSTTISTSEGAPYLNCDFWVAGPAQCQKTFFGYGPTRVVRLYICLSGEV